MSYGKNHLGKEIKKLGFGLMRLPRLEGGATDVEQVKVMADKFMAAGFTYFDTAYVYDGGGSERAIKEALVDRYPRDSFLLATKMNAWIGAPTEEQVKKQFEISLERTGAGYFDYYLLHALQANNAQTYESYGLWEYVKELKAQGKIRHWGFSFHSTPELLDKLLTAHPDAEFVQLQINYADWENPSVQSRACMEVAQKHGVPFVVMEPVKGGSLANPPESVTRIFKAAAPDMSAASWAIRFAASQEGCITVLSGMSNIAQMEDNLSYMTDFKPLDEAEKKVIADAQAAFAAVEQIKCTACKYCVDGCPAGIKIPQFFAALNKKLMNDKGRAEHILKRAIEDSGGATAADCLKCGQCEDACPQRLPIIELLERCAKEL